MLRKILGSVARFNPIRGVRLALHVFANWRHRFTKVDYVLLMLPEVLPALPRPRSWFQRRLFGPPPFSLWDLDRLFDRIAADPRPQGIILHLRGLSLPLADLQTLRDSILRLRSRGKRVVCYAHVYDNAAYYVASAADQIILQPGGELIVPGLRRRALYLKDTLASVGLAVDVVAISPFKGAFDQLSRSAASPEAEQQINWLMESTFDMLVQGIAEGRRMAPDAVRVMIDGALYTDQEALQAGYVDALLNEEGLAAHLGVKHLLPAERARKVLFRRWRRRGKVVAILPVEGLIVQGESGRPPGGNPLPIPFIGGPRSGDLTIVRQIRALMKNRRAAAVVLYVDSGGGSAAASEAIASALAELAKDRPVLVCMNAVAASGGYYVGTPARWIVAHPGTVTGSIGVVTLKPVMGQLWDKLRANVVEYTRGANAAILAENQFFTNSQREIVRKTIERTYDLFLERVTAARRMSREAVDAIGGGRVWTGQQALAHGLIDELGGLRTALAKACSLAALPDDSRVMLVGNVRAPLVPQVAAPASPAGTLRYLYDNLTAICGLTPQLLMPFDWR